jgi:hypothetical protein
METLDAVGNFVSVGDAVWCKLAKNEQFWPCQVLSVDKINGLLSLDCDAFGEHPGIGLKSTAISFAKDSNVKLRLFRDVTPDRQFWPRNPQDVELRQKTALRLKAAYERAWEKMQFSKKNLISFVKPKTTSAVQMLTTENKTQENSHASIVRAFANYLEFALRDIDTARLWLHWRAVSLGQSFIGSHARCCICKFADLPPTPCSVIGCRRSFHQFHSENTPEYQNLIPKGECPAHVCFACAKEGVIERNLVNSCMTCCVGRCAKHFTERDDEIRMCYICESLCE